MDPARPTLEAPTQAAMAGIILAETVLLTRGESIGTAIPATDTASTEASKSVQARQPINGQLRSNKPYSDRMVSRQLRIVSN